MTSNIVRLLNKYLFLDPLNCFSVHAPLSTSLSDSVLNPMFSGSQCGKKAQTETMPILSKRT